MMWVIAGFFVIVDTIIAIGRKVFSFGRLSCLMTMLAVVLLLSGMALPGLTDFSEKVNDWVIAHLQRGGPGGGGRADITRAPDVGDGTEPVYSAETLRLDRRCRIDLPHVPEVYVQFLRSREARSLLRGRFYLKTVGFDTFDGESWSSWAGSLRRVRDEDDGKKDGTIRIGKRKGHKVSYIVACRSLLARILPHISELHSINLPVVFGSGDDLWYCTIAASAPFLSYEATSTPLPAGLPDGAIRKNSKLESKYLAVPRAPFMKHVRAAVGKAVGTNDDTRHIIESCLRYLHNDFEYSLRVDNSEDLDPVENFLVKENRGPCLLFATTFALMLRADGIPCRLGAGYCGGEYYGKLNMFTFFRDNAHVWVEVCLEDQGWVIVDPTPSGVQNAPASPTASKLLPAIDPGRFISLSDMVASAEAGLEDPGPKQRTAIDILKDLFHQQWFLALLFLIGVVTMWIIRTRVEHYSTGTLKTFGPEHWTFLRAFVRHFVRLGFPCHKGQTLHEYAMHLKSAGVMGDDYDDLFDYVYGISYEGAERSEEFEKAVVNRLKAGEHSSSTS